MQAVARAVCAWREAVLDLLYPPRCQVCGGGGQFPLCRECWCSFPRIEPPVCRVCGKPLRGPPELAFTCPGCRRVREALRVRAFGRYEGRLRDAVAALKYRDKLALAQPLGTALAELVRQDPVLSVAEVVVPVPLHPRRQARRGFNQAEELARVVCRGIRRPLRRALVRVRDTPSQTELAQEDRRRNVKDAFAAREEVRGLRVLLVDDVVTTGSTVRECARALAGAGATAVGVAAVAMALPEEGT